jgi:ligand-binding sensor domain-containing protein
MMQKKFFAAVFLLIAVSASSQTNEGWNIYTSFKDVRGIGISGNMVWGATTGGLFSFDINSSSTVKYTTLDGLLSNQLTSMLVDNSGNIWSGASDGAINVYYPAAGNFRVIADILNSTESIKNINGFFQYSNYLFIATEFSIIKFDINRFEFVDPPYIYLGPLMAVKTPVYESIVVNDTIWAATKNGIAYANINNNLPIPSSWANYTSGNSILHKNKVNTVAYFAGRVFFGTDSTMVFHDGNSLYPYAPLYNGIPIGDRVSHMVVSNGNLYFSTYMFSNNIFRVSGSNINSAELIYSGVEVNSLKVGPNGELLIGTVNRGIVNYKNGTSNFVLPNGPNDNLFFFVTVDGNQNLWAASGTSGIFKLTGNVWKNYTASEYPAMRGNEYVHIYPSRYSSDIWASGFGHGLLKIMGDSMYRFDETNSCLKGFAPGFVLVEGVKEDNLGQLWLINRGVPNPILNFTTCDAYPVPTNPGSNTLIFLAIDNYNTKWMTFPPDVTGSERGIAYFNESVPTGRIIRGGELGADITNAFSIAVDRNGEVWVATDNGVAIIRDPFQVIANPYSIPFIEKMRIIENGISTPLTENVQSICVDALNNKWLGTLSNGVLYVSPDGSTILKQFNTSNSPLTDNRVTSIAVDSKSGTVYFGTQKGLSSYNTIAIEALEDCDRITAGPSPFIIPNDKLLRIDGLVEGSSVKILAISGTLVAEFESPGGRIANWDGRDLNGNFVSSGIYIIVGYDNEGSKVCTGKVAVVRK